MCPGVKEQTIRGARRKRWKEELIQRSTTAGKGIFPQSWTGSLLPRLRLSKRKSKLTTRMQERP